VNTPLPKGDDFGYTFNVFIDTPADADVHILLKELGLYPTANPNSNGIVFIKNYGERTLARGGSCWDNSPGWLWDLYFREVRDLIFSDMVSAPLMSTYRKYLRVMGLPITLKN
jgi:hypothetical protein